MHQINEDERQARLAVRQLLAPSATAVGPAEVARGVVALHATDPASVFLSVQARTASVPIEAVEHALYEERSLIRMLGMRRTVFVVPFELAPVVQQACSRAIAGKQRATYLKMMANAGLGDGDWLVEVEEATVAALEARGEATGAQLSTDEPRLRTSLVVAEGKPYEARQNITSWVLFLLAAEGRIVRGRPLGSWTSTQYRWSPMTRWLPDGLPELTVETARAELVRRWLASFGPGTVADLRWWTGWTASEVKQALTVVQPVEVDLGGQTGLVLADDLEPPAAAPEPWVALLPALDPTAMGWKERSWYLGPHSAALFDRSGNVGPTVWCNGRIVGGWAQRPQGEVVYQLLEDIGQDSVALVEDKVQRLTAWIGDTKITPRFRTPLERTLSA